MSGLVIQEDVRMHTPEDARYFPNGGAGGEDMLLQVFGAW